MTMEIPQTFVGRGIGGTRWALIDPAWKQALVAQLVEETGVHALVVRCLVNRGITSGPEITQFLNPNFFEHSHDPLLLRDMEKAVARLHRAVAARERIFLVTDFDVDGTTSSVIIERALRALGGEGLVHQYVPDRFAEGYGLSKQIVNLAADEGYSVIVTADIGIKSHEEARLARERGIDLIICDHHLPDGEDVPQDAFAVLCPKGSSGTGYPNKHLAACGVALKLADALLEKHPKRVPILEALAKLTAIGSIADMVDIAVGENRATVTHGLKGLAQRSSNHGLEALLQVSDVSGQPSTYDVGFKIGPRINAAGRIKHANLVIDLFNASDRARADELANKLDKLNSERRQVQGNLVEFLLKHAESESKINKVLVFSGPESRGSDNLEEVQFHRGIVGIACSKIVEEYGRPTLICAVNEEGIAHGSARSIDGFHIVEALDSVADLLVKYGGHPMAAGFTIKAELLDDFRQRLNDYADQRLTSDDLGKRITADAEISIDDISVELVRELERLEPHGMGNRTPQFLMRNVPIKEMRVLKEKHLKFSLGEAFPRLVDAMWWNAGSLEKDFLAARTMSLIGKLEVNQWNNQFRAQIIIRDASPDPPLFS
jgi:single-stranded-DNA-specific exonuclease